MKATEITTDVNQGLHTKPPKLLRALMERRTWSRIAGAASVAGLLVGYVGGAMMHFPPFIPQRLLQNPIADILVVAMLLVTAISVGVWARQSSHSDKRVFAAAITSLGGLTVLLNVMAPAVGWWGGRIFEGPLLPLASLTGLRAMFLLSLLMLLYRWLAARRMLLARLTYLVILLALVPATAIGDQILLRSGVLTFSAGYTIWHDVMLAEFVFALPAIIYDLFHRYSRA